MFEWDDSRVNLDPVDRWSLLHLGGWYLAGKNGVPPAVALAAILGWEVVENGVKDNFPELFVHPVHDSRENIIADIAIGLLGYHLGRTPTKT